MAVRYPRRLLTIAHSGWVTLNRSANQPETITKS